MDINTFIHPPLLSRKELKAILNKLDIVEEDRNKLANSIGATTEIINDGKVKIIDISILRTFMNTSEITANNYWTTFKKLKKESNIADKQLQPLKDLYECYKNNVPFRGRLNVNNRAIIDFLSNIMIKNVDASVIEDLIESNTRGATYDAINFQFIGYMDNQMYMMPRGMFGGLCPENVLVKLTFAVCPIVDNIDNCPININAEYYPLNSSASNFGAQPVYLEVTNEELELILIEAIVGKTAEYIYDDVSGIQPEAYNISYLGGYINGELYFPQRFGCGKVVIVNNVITEITND